MKLKHLLKGHRTDDCVRITNGFRSVEWNGAGIEHVAMRYTPEFLEKEVKSTTKAYNGRTVIYV